MKFLDGAFAFVIVLLKSLDKMFWDMEINFLKV